jgi:hypothetical protein
MVTSIGVQGFTSMPCSHAAVLPEKAAPGGSRRATALNNNCGLSGKPTHR